MKRIPANSPSLAAIARNNLGRFRVLVSVYVTCKKRMAYDTVRKLKLKS